MRILITGGMGFVGRYIAKYLLDCGHDITATYRKFYDRKAVEGVCYVHQDISRKITIDGHFDAIVHTACCRPGENVSVLDHVRDNLNSAIQLVDFAQKKGIDNIIYFSTRSVYGQIRQSIVDESSDVINPDIYGLTKLLAEKVFIDATDINTIGLRTPGIIGPGAHDIWLSGITRMIMDNEDVTVSDFETKNLAYVKDIASFINRLLIGIKNGVTCRYPVVNLACRESINNQTIAQIIKDKVHSTSQIIVKEASPELFILNAERAFSMGFEPSAPAIIVSEYVDSVIRREV